MPVQVHKLVSVCILYSLGFSELLAAAGLDTGDSGLEPIPDELVGRGTPDAPRTANDDSARNKKQPRFLSPLIVEFQEIPLFLRHSLSTVAGLPDLSLRDVFWTGGRTVSLHPYLKDAVFVSVNRRLKNPVFFKRKPLWEQPLYILLLRDGTYLVAGCSLEESTLVVHPFADGFSVRNASEWSRCGSGWRGHGALPPAEDDRFLRTPWKLLSVSRVLSL